MTPRPHWLALGLLLVAVVAAGCSSSVAQVPGKGGAKGGPPEMPPPKVLVAAAIEEEVPDLRTFVGTVWPVRRSLIGSAAPGRVEEFLVNEGVAVKAGQPIAHLRRGIIAAELDAAKAQLAVRQSELKELETSFQDEIEQAQAKLSLAEANLTYRRAKLARSKSLGPSVAKELLEEDSSLAAQAAASVLEAQAALRLLTGGARQQKTEQARASAEAQAAEVARLTEQFERHTMYAPFDGFVSAEHTEVGQWVMQGDPVAEVVELKQVEIGIGVVEDNIAALDLNTKATVEIPALEGQTFAGQISLINQLADAKARTFSIKVRLDNDLSTGQPLIKAGMLARVTLPVGKPRPRVLVPKDAVVLGQAPMVAIVDESQGKKVVRPVPVKITSAHGQWFAIEGPVKKDELLIVEGNERVRPGQEVRPQTKEIPPPEGAASENPPEQGAAL
jgi:RND family efflux transporter MFP subunit